MVQDVAAAPFPPPAAKKYLRAVVREAHYRGLPPENVAGQIHQESGWDGSAASRYAAGLAQFTPDTVAFVQTTWPREFQEGGALTPAWAIRAMCRYDRWLLDRTGQDYALALRAYNGGLGWLRSEAALEQAEASKENDLASRFRKGCPTETGAACAAKKCRRFRSAASCAENLDYPHRILEVWAPKYKAVLNPFGGRG